MGWDHWIGMLAAAAFALGAGALINLGLVWGAARARRPGRAGGAWASRDGPAVFLFEGARLLDATPTARRLLRGASRAGSDLARLLALLEGRFGTGLGAALADLPDGERLVLPASGSDGALEAETVQGTLRITLRLDAPEAVAPQLALEAAVAENALLRALADDAPGAIWALDADGALIWANRAYLHLADIVRPEGELAEPPPTDPTDSAPGPEPPAGGTLWPSAPLIPPPPGLAEGQAEIHRHALAVAGQPEPHWVEVTSIRRGPGSVHFATDLDRLVAAESARSSFVQTIAKTFAHLATGLAVFDRRRRLVFFNPAFADLTGLSVVFLTGKPLIHTVLDRLRESQVLPEPRDYASWREAVAALEAAAADGHYAETWPLPDGRTFRVAGRPHPEGALAFFVEDITDEITLARRFRAEVETARAVLDAVGEAVAVFSPSGTLSLSNAAYDELWSAVAPEMTVAGLPLAGLLGEVARWEAASGPQPIWSELRAGRVVQDGASRTAGLAGPDGTPLACRVTPLPGGGLAVGFSRAADFGPRGILDDLPVPAVLRARAAAAAAR